MARFFVEGPGCKAYVLCRDSPTRRHHKDRIEELWAKYEPYCPDPHFLSQARTNYLERTWEMYLACTLLGRGFTLRPTQSKGPDICVEAESLIWIEAIAPTAGDGHDAVPTRDSRGRTIEVRPGIKIWQGQPPSDESLILRCTNALKEKRAKWQTYLRDGIVDDKSSYVVAINLAGIDGAEDASDDDDPLIVKALFGIGEDHLEILWPDGTVQHGTAPRPTVTKRSGAEVSASAFASSACHDVSGVFCTSSSISNVLDEPGADLIYVHNPYGSRRVQDGTFQFGTEIIPSGGRFLRRRWSRPPWR